MIAPDETARVHLVTGVAETRDGALGLIEKYRDRHLADRVFELAWTHSQVVLRQLDATEADTQLYGRLASSILYANPLLRAPGSVIARNRRGQSGLWGYGISGDLPIVLLRIGDVAHIELVRQLVQAHAYWRVKGLAVDLVIWNEDQSGYRQVLQDEIMGVIASRGRGEPARQAGRHLRAPQRADVGGGQGPDADRRAGDPQRHRPARWPSRWSAGRAPRRPMPAFSPIRAPPDRAAGRGGGASAATWSRSTASAASRRTAASTSSRPRPSRRRRRRGSTCSPTRGSAPSSARAAARTPGARTPTATGSRPWHNDPVSDASGEAFYVRDEDDGPLLVADAAAGARADAVHDPPRLRLQHLRVRRGRHRHASCGRTSRPTRRSSSSSSSCATAPAGRGGCR